ncbi:MAG: LPXTG cell wall anchor domain-containing protein [Spirochaetota bacterium]
MLDEGLEGALGVHIANNVIGTILIEPAAGIGYYGQLFRNIGPNTGDGMFSVLFYLGLALLFLFIYYYKRINIIQIKSRLKIK